MQRIIRRGAHASVRRVAFSFIELLMLVTIAVVLLGGPKIEPLQLDGPMLLHEKSLMFDAHRVAPMR